MRTLLAFLLLTAATAQAGIVADTNPGTIAAAEINLPEDGHAWYCTLFTSGKNTDGERRLQSWFVSNPQLAKLKAQTHFGIITPANSTWPRYWEGITDANGVQHDRLIGSVPAVVVQAPAGNGAYRVVAKFQAPSKYFADASTLATAIAACIRAETLEVGGDVGKRHIFARPWNPNRPCPDCTPKPEPSPQPYQPDYGPKPLVPDIEPPDPIEEAEEEGREEEVADETTFMVVLAAIGVPVGLLAVVVGLILGWQLYKPKHKFYKHR